MDTKMLSKLADSANSREWYEMCGNIYEPLNLAADKIDALTAEVEAWRTENTDIVYDAKTGFLVENPNANLN